MTYAQLIKDMQRVTEHHHALRAFYLDNYPAQSGDNGLLYPCIVCLTNDQNTISATGDIAINFSLVVMDAVLDDGRNNNQVEVQSACIRYLREWLRDLNDDLAFSDPQFTLFGRETPGIRYDNNAAGVAANTTITFNDPYLCIPIAKPKVARIAFLQQTFQIPNDQTEIPLPYSIEGFAGHNEQIQYEPVQFSIRGETDSNTTIITAPGKATLIQGDNEHSSLITITATPNNNPYISDTCYVKIGQ